MDDHRRVFVQSASGCASETECRQQQKSRYSGTRREKKRTVRATRSEMSQSRRRWPEPGAAPPRSGFGTRGLEKRETVGKERGRRIPLHRPLNRFRHARGYPVLIATTTQVQLAAHRFSIDRAVPRSRRPARSRPRSRRRRRTISHCRFRRR